MDIDGKNYGTSSVSRGLARKRLSDSEKGGKKEPESRAAGGAKEPDGKAVLAAHGEHGAKKSFHAFEHDGKVTSHAHDHETGDHEQREHESMAGAKAHMAEHMGGGEDNGEPYDEAANAIDGAGTGASAGDEDQGIGGINT